MKYEKYIQNFMTRINFMMTFSKVSKQLDMYFMQSK